MKLSIGFISNRKQDHFEWFYDSLAPQIKQGEEIEIIVINPAATNWRDRPLATHALPKPCSWSGPERLTSKDWWSKANSLNTFFCMATHPFVALVDDRCIAQPGWLNRVRLADRGGYMVCGTYTKRHGMLVNQGHILDHGELDGEDGRLKSLGKVPVAKNETYLCNGEWAFGCHYALPLAWALECNGADERTNGLGFEDVLFGFAIRNNNHPVHFDPKMSVIQDRTPLEVGSTPRSSKEKHPGDKTDKAWTLLGEYRDKGRRRADHHFDIDKMREYYQEHRIWAHQVLPTEDWFDQQPLTEL